MEALGTAAAALQIFQTLSAVQDLYARIQDAPVQLERYKTQVLRLHEAIDLVKNLQPQPPTVSKHLDSIREVSYSLTSLLEARSLRRARLKAALSPKWDSKIQDRFRILQGFLQSLTLAINVMNSQRQQRTDNQQPQLPIITGSEGLLASEIERQGLGKALVRAKSADKNKATSQEFTADGLYNKHRFE